MRPYNNSKNLRINSKNLTIKNLKTFKNGNQRNPVNCKIGKVIVRFSSYYEKNTQNHYKTDRNETLQ